MRDSEPRLASRLTLAWECGTCPCWLELAGEGA
jgi:hypothetical protein